MVLDKPGMNSTHVVHKCAAITDEGYSSKWADAVAGTDYEGMIPLIKENHEFCPYEPAPRRADVGTERDTRQKVAEMQELRDRKILSVLEG